MNWLQRIMYGRYGVDSLTWALMAVYLILSLLSQLFFHSPVLSLLASMVAVWSLYRVFSRRIDRRRAENARFVEMVRPIVRWYNVNKCRRHDKDHCYFKCPNCGQQLRVPKGKGRISITCRSCGASFEEKT